MSPQKGDSHQASGRQAKPALPLLRVERVGSCISELIVMSTILHDKYEAKPIPFENHKNLSNASTEEATLFEQSNSSMKIGNLRVNIRSRFYPKKSLCDIMFSIASARLKEK